MPVIVTDKGLPIVQPSIFLQKLIANVKFHSVKTGSLLQIYLLQIGLIFLCR